MLKRYKKDFDYSYAIGVFTTLELLEHNPGSVREVLLHSKGLRNEGVAKIRRICQQQRIRLTESDKTVEKITGRGNDYAIGVFGKTTHRLDSEADHVVLVNPSDMGNLGTIMRTMLGFGFANLALIEPAADPYDPRTVRASMGAIYQIAFSLFPTFAAYRDTFSRPAYALMTDGQFAVNRVDFRHPLALVFGSESSGLPDEYHTLTEASLFIPQSDRVDSLNLAVAVGVALYELKRG